MMRLAWLTDLHLNFVGLMGADGLCRRILQGQPEALLITGDIGEATDVGKYLEFLDRELGLPIYFVLGNHDYYRGSIAEVRQQVAGLCARSPRLHWLNTTGLVELTPETGLVGHDGWADGRLGDYAGSEIMFNDYFLIRELTGLDAEARLDRLQALGDEAAEHFRRLLPEALARFRWLIALTHVPPFREACWYQGRVSGDAWLPHLTCKAVGDAFAEAMSTHPDRELLVLCGHTHSPGEAQILPNLRVRTGGAEYGRPALQDFIVVS
jgi:3',5'-cyclic-AMP phosphodiesterase